MIKMFYLITALYGEMYFDLSDDTKLTIGARYQDDETTSWTYNDTALEAGWQLVVGLLITEIHYHL